MKLIRKSLTALFAAMFILAVGVFAAGCSKKVTLSFDTAGGPSVSAVQVSPGEEVTLPEPGNYPSHEFAGWYLNADYTGQSYTGKVTAPDKDTTYYARWNASYTVTFELGGGSLSTASVEVRGGANLYNAVKDFVPVKEGLEFGAWFLNGNEVVTTTSMPENNITLEARYKVEYRTEYYLQSLDQKSYELSGSRTKIKSDYVGKEITVASEAVDGFSFLPEYAGNVTTLTLSEMKEGNILKFYYNRDTFPITYDSNIAAGYFTGSVPSSEGLFGSDFTLQENGFKADGYRFAGWGRDPNGKVEFLPGESVEIDGYMTIYAIWDVGHTERFGSTDLIYVLQLDPTKVILERGGYEYEGTINGNNDFTLSMNGGKQLKGKVFTTDFIYTQEGMAGTYTYIISYWEYFDKTDRDEDINDGGIIESVKLTLDDNLCGTLESQGNNLFGDVSYTGYVAYSARYDMDVFYSDSGSELFGLYFAEYNNKKYFLLSGQETGPYVNLAMNGLSTYGAINGDLQMYLDGFGHIELVSVSGSTETRLEGVYSVGSYLQYNNGNMYLVDCLIHDEEGVLGIEDEDGDGWVEYPFYTMPYSSQFSLFVRPNMLRGEYKDAQGGEDKLELDGYAIAVGSAVYTKDGKEIECAYAADETNLYGPYVVLAYVDDKGTSDDTSDDETKYITVTIDFEHLTFNVEEFEGENFAEYISVLVYEGEGARLGEYSLIVHPGNTAELYYRDGRDFKLAAVGTTSDEETQEGGLVNYYTFTKGDKDENEDIDEALYDTIPETFTYIINTNAIGDTTGVMRRCFYPVSWKIDGEEEDPFTEVLTGTGAQSGATIKLRYIGTEETHVRGVGSIYTDPRGNVFDGSLEISKDENFGVTIGNFVYIDYEQGAYVYFPFDIETGADGKRTFKDGAVPIELHRYLEDGSVAEEAELILRGDAVTGVPARYKNENGEWIKGTATQDKVSDVTTSVMEFVSEDNSVKLTFVAVQIPVNGVNVSVFGVYNEKIDSAENAIIVQDMGDIVTDGCIAAIWRMGETPIQGTIRQLSRDDDTLCIGFVPIMMGTTITIEFEYNTITKMWQILDDAYGQGWMIVDESAKQVKNYFIDFDGKADYAGTQGVAKVYEGEFNEETRKVEKKGEVLSTGSYELFQGTSIIGRVTLHTKVDGLEETFVFRVEEYADSTTYLHNCVLLDDSTEGSFSDEDWNVLELDGYGTGYYWTRDGYTRVSYQYINRDEGVIFLMLQSSTAARGYETAVYKLDSENRSFSSCTTDETKVYYASDLSALGFEPNGTAYVGGKTGVYYCDNSEVYFYTLDENGLVNSECKEIETSLGDTVTYSEKTYKRFEGEKDITLTGKIEMAEDNSKEATITFKLGTVAWIEHLATFKVGDNEYQVGIYNYDVGENNEIKLGVRIYAEFKSSDITVTEFDASKGTGKFTAQGGEVEIKLTDTSDNKSTLTKKYKGFGPYYAEEATYSGKLYYLDEDNEDAKALTFEDKPSYIRSSTNGYTRELILFDGAEDKKYALDFNNGGEDNGFALRLLLNYEEYEVKAAEDKAYILGLGKVEYKNPNYVFTVDKGEYTYVMLWEKDGDSRKIVYSVDSSVNASGTKGYYLKGEKLDSQDVVESFTFTVERKEGEEATAKISSYSEYSQALSTDILGYIDDRAVSRYFVNIFSNGEDGENGEEVVAAFAVYDASIGGYRSLEIESFEELGEGEDGFKITVKDGDETKTFKLVFVKDDEGEREHSRYYSEAFNADIEEIDE